MADVEMLTAKDMQDLLQVDRSTIYRMADDGRLPAIKVGKQWRFPRPSIDRYLQVQANQASMEPNIPDSPPTPNYEVAWPLACAQATLDGFADLLEVMMVLTDVEGEPITRVSNPMPFYELIGEDQGFHDLCHQRWREMGQMPAIEPRFVPSFADLLCARAFVRVGSEIQAMVIAFGIAPGGWSPSDQILREMSEKLGLERPEVEEVFRAIPLRGREERQHILSHLQSIADILSHICTERHHLLNRLNQIAELSSLDLPTFA